MPVESQSNDREAGVILMKKKMQMIKICHQKVIAVCLSFTLCLPLSLYFSNVQHTSCHNENKYGFYVREYAIWDD